MEYRELFSSRIVLLGAGNVAHHLASALLKTGFNLCQIYSRTIESARELGKKTGISYTADTFAVYPDGDIYIFCVSDDALLPLLKGLRINEKAVVIHTSGSLPLDVFPAALRHTGVLYPLQTFSKKRDLDFGEVPLFLEFSDTEAKKTLYFMAEHLSRYVKELSSDKRLKLHLAAVFACNFTNHLYRLSELIVEDAGMDFSVLRPLIFETAHKAMSMLPAEAQTGPAVRQDDSILSKHKQLLKEDKKKYAIYTTLSDSIKNDCVRKEEEPESEDKQMTLW